MKIAKLETNASIHRPVLLKEVLEIFNPEPGEIYIDATINGGGHGAVIAEKISPGGILLGIDLDCDLIEAAKLKIKDSKFKVKFIPVCDNYVNLKKIADGTNFKTVDGILFDLGFSSYHIEKSGRGFSFLRNEPLDMRYNPQLNDLTAEKIINTWPEKAIENIFREYGQERFARNMARGIARARIHKRINRTAELVEIISRSVPSSYLRKRIHPATKIFQALRIAVNQELENLKIGLEGAMDILTSGGKIVVISFHSLEDRLVKLFLKEKERGGLLRIITDKPLSPSLKEVIENNKARSARLRAAQKIL